MVNKLHIDIETFSSVDLKTSGVYKYMESVDFEILMIAYAIDDQEIQISDLAQGERIPEEFLDLMYDPSVEKHAHNATFERNAFRTYGIDVPIDQWRCSMVKAAYCGLPLSLKMVSKVLELGDQGKSDTGAALIKFFSLPIKATKANGNRTRNFPEHDRVKWEEFKEYCKLDVEAERAIDDRLLKYEYPEFERQNYILDQKINDRGILTDLGMAKNATEIDLRFSREIKEWVKEATGLENPNSPAQLKKWVGDKMQKEIKSLAKDVVGELLKEAGPGLVSDVLKARKKLAKSSTKKYISMLNCACEDERVHGLFQFYGANRTGRWAGRLVQMQNLPQNHLPDLEEAREIVAKGDYDLMKILYEDVSSILSQLIRTAFIAKPGHTFAVSDFSAIEARVIAWLAEEQWRIKVFEGDGKIYEASAAMMFNVPIEEISKGSDLRQKGKTAELALGYQGSIGAMTQMGGERMGLSEKEMKAIVTKWRAASPQIVALWNNLDLCARKAVLRKSKVVSKFKNLEFEFNGEALTIKLPSGRKLFYWGAKIVEGKWGKNALAYGGVYQKTGQWGEVDTYGGKLAENIVQAISRDILADSMLRLDKQGYDIVMHVHDEAAMEIPDLSLDPCADAACWTNEDELERINDIMGENIPWAEGLPLNAEGYITPFYKKD